MFNFDFLVKFHSELYSHLDELFKINKQSACFIIKNKYKYSWKDWFTGKMYRIPL